VKEGPSITSPCSVNDRLLDGETGAKLKKWYRRQPLGENVGKLRSDRNMKHTYFSDLNADKMDIKLNMLGSSMLKWVCQEVYS
jgi:hypothetical protein